MFKTDYKKLIIFILLTCLFSAFSVFGKFFMLINYYTKDFKLFSVDYLENTGAAFSLLYDYPQLLIILSIMILGLVAYYIFKNVSKFTPIELFFTSLLTAGIICNLYERIFDGFVTDYIRLNFMVFPVFNISDIYITIGAFVLICNILFSNDKENN